MSQPTTYIAMAEENKEVVLITGANVGLGLEIAKKLLMEHSDRFHVLIGCRTLSKGEAAVKELHDKGFPGCEVIQIEVTNDESIAKAAKTVEERFRRVDVLHVNVSLPQHCWYRVINKSNLTYRRLALRPTKTCSLPASPSPRSSWRQWPPTSLGLHKLPRHSCRCSPKLRIHDSSSCPAASAATNAARLSRITPTGQPTPPARRRRI